ncbi:hypothetical protein DOTSEDRAFT_150320 [Dothistroma septosporum NZE10]|uniref:Uncharacterized protein n=1 Tax=Dothistroma septosporum (strain NZE10 / CBS 128990) TaxID=675120 RepID=N1PQV9_DOTSN|nr:hypothetical protein DOTSEDRAFT_150320 [Dothistroma septosporum NZE10]
MRWLATGVSGWPPSHVQVAALYEDTPHGSEQMEREIPCCAAITLAMCSQADWKLEAGSWLLAQRYYHPPTHPSSPRPGLMTATLVRAGAGLKRDCLILPPTVMRRSYMDRTCTNCRCGGLHHSSLLPPSSHPQPPFALHTVHPPAFVV